MLLSNVVCLMTVNNCLQVLLLESDKQLQPTYISIHSADYITDAVSYIVCMDYIQTALLHYYILVIWDKAHITSIYLHAYVIQL